LNANETEWIGDDLTKTKKQINIVGASLKAGQAKALGHLLEKTGTASEGTAVVLPDENLLMPVLHSIPEDVSSLNVTMGFPFRNSVLYNLVIALKNLQKNKKVDGDKTKFYHKNCIQILSHPYIKLFNAGKCFKIINEINRRNIISIDLVRILQFTEEGEKIFELIFRDASDSNNTIKYLFDIMSEISSLIEEKTPYNQRFEKEFFFVLYDSLSHLKNLILKYQTDIGTDTLWNLIIEILSHTRIPFTGEPLKGLQVMGLLETRSIDFENVYILSMNEGTVPRGNSKGSFIPYNLRKAFKMPTYEDDDASFAYYFYRLIQRAKNVTLIYNTETIGVQPGEKSRYILQLQNELAKQNKNITIKEFIFQPGIGTFPEKHIKVNKTPEIVDLLAGREFSPSAISQYITCSLKFYLNRIARLRMDISVEEVLSGAAFGSLLHEIMKQLYIVKKNKIMTKKDLDEIKKALEKNFDTMWKNACKEIEDLKEFADGLSGKNLLFKNVIKKLVKLILENDVHEVPFNILEIEGALTGEIETEANGNKYKIKLRGILDRVEEKNGVTKIIDYKTGLFKMKGQESKTIEEYFNEVFSDPKYKESFQQYFYAMLFHDTFPSAKLNIGIYPLRSIGKGIEFYEDSNCIPPEKLAAFRKKLKEKFSEIFDINIPFQKTDKTENCKFCDFIPICYREQGR
ncbi:MAG TPA: PD-(D/E)XK nuclease family protein, partial [Ignavibacteria bacterium]